MFTGALISFHFGTLYDKIMALYIQNALGISRDS